MKNGGMTVINHAAPTLQSKYKRSLGYRLKADFRRYKYVYLMLIPVIAYYVLFKYLPMTNMVIAFQDFKLRRGIAGSKWVGLENFIDFFQMRDCPRLIRNTLLLNLWSIVFAFPAPILFALMLNEVNNKAVKKTMQTISYMPHFISMVVLCGLVRNFCSSGGVINAVISLFDKDWVPANLLGFPDDYRPFPLAWRIWQNVGWDSIISLATLSGIDPQLYDAADLDGASKLRRIWHITLPGLVPIMVVKFIMRLGNIMSVSSEKTLLLYNALTYETADTIPTYMYRYGLLDQNYSMGAAVGVINSVLSIVILVSVNKFFRRFTEESLW